MVYIYRMNESGPDNPVKSLQAAARAEVEALQANLLRIQKSLKKAQERLTLLDQLAALEDGSSGEPAPPVRSSLEFLDACERILREAEKPMHVAEIHAALLEVGVAIPGRGTLANVVTRLQRSEGRFIRTGRGTYGLQDFGLPEMKPTRSRRARRTKGA